MPWLAKLAPDKTGFSKLLMAVQDLRDAFHILIKKRQATHSKEVMNDFLDFYLTEIEETVDEESSFYREAGGTKDCFVCSFHYMKINKFVCVQSTISSTYYLICSLPAQTPHPPHFAGAFCIY